MLYGHSGQHCATRLYNPPRMSNFACLLCWVQPHTAPSHSRRPPLRTDYVSSDYNRKPMCVYCTGTEHILVELPKYECKQCKNDPKMTPKHNKWSNGQK